MGIKSIINKFTIYQYMIVFLIILHLTSAFFYGFGAKSLIPAAIAVLTATLLDFAINYFKLKTFEFPQSAFISGLFIAGLLTQNLQWYIYALAGAIAILSKHIIKIDQRHIFNPANLGVLFVSMSFNVSHTWWISSPLVLALIFGVFMVWRLRRFDLAISFLAGYYLINSIIGLSQGAQFQEIYYTILNGGVIYFFSMFMLIEPRTNPAVGKQRIAYGVLVAVLFIVFHSFIPRHDLPLALAVGNIFVPILNRVKFEFKKKQSKPSISETLKIENY
ncbi:RnfABCDGE type electron transport complex subunit D [Candidatus Woesearchaeota archaeon]|nr:RnfABCDGE type electron transport complex subunit D [Candidatus Woesearchaeota archaeon]